MIEPRVIPILVCIDAEPDERRPNPEHVLPWTGLTAAVDYLEKMRFAFSELSGFASSFSWFFRVDHQVEHVYGQSDWALHEYAEIISDLLESGDEIGLHVHAWRWNSGLNDWVADHGDQSWVESQLADAFQKYYRFFGAPCRSFRFGDHWMNQRTMDLLKEYGVRYDLTVETGRFPRRVLVQGEHATGMLPDYRRVGSRPYRPADGDYLKENRSGTGDFWIIPVGAGLSMPMSPVWYKRKIKKTVLSCLPHVEKKALNLGYFHPMAFRETVEDYMKRKEFPHLVLAMRTDALQHPRQFEWLDQNLNYLLNHAAAPSFRFVRPETFVEMYQNGSACEHDALTTVREYAEHV